MGYWCVGFNDTVARDSERFLDWCGAYLIR